MIEHPYIHQIHDFLDALGNTNPDESDDELAIVLIQKERGLTDGFTRVRPKESPEFDMLKRVRNQLGKKLKR